MSTVSVTPTPEHLDVQRDIGYVEEDPVTTAAIRAILDARREPEATDGTQPRRTHRQEVAHAAIEAARNSLQ